MSEKKTDDKKQRSAEAELQEKQAVDQETAKKLEQGKAEIMKLLEGVQGAGQEER